MSHRQQIPWRLEESTLSNWLFILLQETRRCFPIVLRRGLPSKVSLSLIVWENRLLVLERVPCLIWFLQSWQIRENMSSGQHKNVLFAQENENKPFFGLFGVAGTEAGWHLAVEHPFISRNVLIPSCPEFSPRRTMTFLLSGTIWKPIILQDLPQRWWEEGMLWPEVWSLPLQEVRWAARGCGGGGMGRETLDSGVFITRTPSPDPRIDKALC